MALRPSCYGGGLGSGPFGSYPFGAGGPGGIWQAVATSQTTILVDTSWQPSALADPAYWTVELDGGGALTVSAVVEVVPNVQWELTVAPGMIPGGVDYRVFVDAAAAGGLMDGDCAEIVLQSLAAVAYVEHCQGGAFGSAPFGSGAFGSGFVGGLFAAAVLNANTVDVFTVPVAPAELLDPANWTVVPLAGGAPVAVVSVTEVSAGTRWRLTLSPGMTFGAYQVSFSAAAAVGLFDLGCLELTVEGPADPVYPTAPAPAYGDQPYDIANPWLVRDAGIVDPPPLGQYQVNDRGDFALDSRLQGLRKRIMRRIGTMRDGFVLLPGYGLARKVKGSIRPVDVHQLAADARLQVLREPEVVRAQVLVQQLRTAPSVLVLAVKARTVDGLDVTASQQIDLRPTS